MSESERRFFVEVPASGERCYYEVLVRKGRVEFIEHTTNPNYGGASGLGEPTFAQLMEQGPPPQLPAELAFEVMAYVRSQLLRSAVAEGDVSAVRRLLQAGAALSEPGSRTLPQVQAARSPRMLLAFLAAGADPSRADSEGRTALDEAIAHQSSRALTLLLATGAMTGVAPAVLVRLRAAAASHPNLAALIDASLEDPIDFALREIERGLRAFGEAADAEDRDECARHVAAISTRLARVELQRIVPHLAAPLSQGTIGDADSWRRQLEQFRQIRKQQGGSPPSGDPIERALVEILEALKSIGQANDAMDRGFTEAADRIMGGVFGHMVKAWSLAPDALAALLPEHAAGFATGTFSSSHWGPLSDVVDAALQRHRASAK
jgi:hypothetical protein